MLELLDEIRLTDGRKSSEVGEPAIIKPRGGPVVTVNAAFNELLKEMMHLREKPMLRETGAAQKMGIGNQKTFSPIRY